MWSVFDSGKEVEARAVSILLPFLKKRSCGRVVMTSKGAMARFLQETAGDFICNMGSAEDPDCWTIELKAEINYAKRNGRIQKNLFLETWSNKNLDSKCTHAERGSNPGWMVKCRADLLFYYFIEPDDLYIIDFFKLKQWAFGNSEIKGKIYSYPEVIQKKYDQKNDTHGRIVMAKSIIDMRLGRLIHPRQIPLDFMEVA